MPKTKNIFMQEFRARPVAYVLQVGAIFVLFLNIWLATKLAPLAKGLDEVVVRVEAAEEKVSKLEDSCSKNTALNNDILIELKTISTQLNAVESRLERVDSRLSKHLGI